VKCEFRNSEKSESGREVDCPLTARLKNTIPVADLISWCRTDGTSSGFDQRDQNLLRIIPYIGGKNRKAPPCGAISTDENNSITTSTLQWCQTA
jgi:hypothetical protein